MLHLLLELLCEYLRVQFDLSQVQKVVHERLLGKQIPQTNSTKPNRIEPIC